MRNYLVLLHSVMQADEFHCYSILVLARHVFAEQTLLLSRIQLAQHYAQYGKSG